MSSVNFHYDGIGEMLRSDFMVEHMLKRANQMKDYAEAIAPVSTSRRNPHRGRYKASFSVTSTTHGGFKNNRAQATLTNDSPEAVFVEFGTSNNQGRHVLMEAMLHGAPD